MHMFPLPASQVVSVSSSNLFTSCIQTCKLPVAPAAVPNQVPAPVSEEQQTPYADLRLWRCHSFLLESLLSELLKCTQMAVFEGEIRWKNKDIIGSFLI